MLQTLIAFLAGLITASTTIYTNKTNYKVIATKDLYYKTFFPMYLILQDDIILLNTSWKVQIHKNESEINAIKAELSSIICNSNGAFPNDLDYYLHTLSSENYRYFCRYIDDSCRSCQKYIGYKPQISAYGKWGILRERIRGFIQLFLVFLLFLLALLAVWGLIRYETVLLCLLIAATILYSIYCI